MSFLSSHFPEFSPALQQVDGALNDTCPFDSKIDELLRFALSVKARSAPCVRKHYRGALAAGATDAEIAWVFALTMREAAGADECWTQSVIADLSAAHATDETNGAANGAAPPASCCG